ncbi:hypothetical protein [Stenotrophomonas sp.]|uniref:hypothetical protein n=1 Tax=Stenotrophomonas sp. TaxID=69392 RepID=UPI00289A1ED1|nr:hypothetical protein [Stenotrophomonas sp.]
MRSLALLALALICLPVTAAAVTPREPARVAPGPTCLDARGLRDMNQTDADSVTVLDADQQPWRVHFQSACPGVDDAADAVLEAPSGWACGGPRERVRIDGRHCPIASVARIDAREFAAEAKLSDARTVKSLPTVQVQAASETGSRFRASPAYCFSARALRSWSEDPDGIKVETNPKQSGGNRYYRVELGTYCPEVTNAPEIAFRSGFGNGLICGNPGDRIIASQALPGDLRRQSNPRNYLGCAVMAVYPVR